MNCAGLPGMNSCVTEAWNFGREYQALVLASARMNV